ncbi:hypothetical protein CPC16_010117 [Podila verticillata]|nr:hypothetical protein CPC16_010117 [Podila verticillata]KAI9239902.1 MAG: methyltransferase TYW3-domain-containing protein [Podila humilis]
MSLDGFHSRKKAILIALNSDTPDKSPKGYVDEPLLPLIVLINTHADYVTTSSCSGRICTYLEGLDEGAENSEEGDSNTNNNEEEEPKGFDENTSLAAVEASKRAKGGQWLYVSHDPVELVEQEEGLNSRWIIDTLFGPEAHRVVTMEEQQQQKHAQQIKTLGMARSQLVYFKFEPMILHIEASTPTAAKQFLNHSLFSGYRNSGILPSAKRTMLAIRSTLKLDAPIAYIPHPSSTSSTASSHPIYLMVSLTYLRVLIELSNDKFRANVDQMSRFEQRLSEHLVGANSTQAQGGVKQGDQGAWEDKDARRERKKREGLERAAAAAAAAERARKAEEAQEEPTPMES